MTGPKPRWFGLVASPLPRIKVGDGGGIAGAVGARHPAHREILVGFERIFMWVYLKLLVTALVWGGTFVAVSAIILAFFILGEPITWSLLVGGLFVISGVYLANIRSYEPFQTSP